MTLSLILFNLMMMQGHLLLPCTMCNVQGQAYKWILAVVWSPPPPFLAFFDRRKRDSRFPAKDVYLLMGDVFSLVLNYVQSRIPVSQKLPAVQVRRIFVWKKFSCSYSAAATASVQDKRVLSPHVELWTPPLPWVTRHDKEITWKFCWAKSLDIWLLLNRKPT